MAFADVAQDSWYAEAVGYVAGRGIMNGYDEEHFGPEQLLSRGQLSQVLHNLAGKPAAEESGTPFADVPADSWCAEAIRWAWQEKIISGYDAETFGLQGPITRQQMAAVLYRYAAGQGYDLTASADLSAYTDADSVGGYARTAVAWANAKGGLMGVDAETLLPRGNATRAQIAAMLMRFCAVFADPV